jgi:hypothetical protein
VGTSSSYRGPAGRNPLLPPWAEEPPATGFAEGEQSANDGHQAPVDGADQNPSPTEAQPQPVQQTLPPVTPRPWGKAKEAMGKAARAGARSDANTRGVGRRFVASLGGARRAATSSPAGRTTTARLGGFLAGVARDGAARTFERLGLAQYVGQSLAALLVALGELLAPTNETTDDAFAAVALHETMAELVEELGVEEHGIDAFSRIDEGVAKHTMERYVARLVTARLLHVLSAELESGAVSADRAVAVEFEIGDFVESSVAIHVDVGKLTDLDWNAPEAKAIADDIVRQGYEVFGTGS